MRDGKKQPVLHIVICQNCMKLSHITQTISGIFNLNIDEYS